VSVAIAAPLRVELTSAMSNADARCVLLADRHHRLMEGVRGLLETEFEVVVMVADEVSLLESARRLKVDVAVVDLSLTRENLDLIRRIRIDFPLLNLIVLSVYDEPGVYRAVLEAGANGFVLKSSIASDLLPAVEALRAGQSYVSPKVMQ
jgi:DNA-binding NarL/FixJ family response regulator